MLWTRNLSVCLCVFCLSVGCSQEERPEVESTAVATIPSQAQPQLTQRRLYVGPTEVNAEIAIRPKEIMTGMMFRTNVTDADAMLFVLPSPRQAGFWMMNCPSPLSCAYIDPDGIIAEIHDMEPFNTNSIESASANILFVLETAQGWFDRNQVTTGMLVRAESGSLVETFFRTRNR